MKGEYYHNTLYIVWNCQNKCKFKKIKKPKELVHDLIKKFRRILRLWIRNKLRLLNKSCVKREGRKEKKEGRRKQTNKEKIEHKI